MGGADAFSSGDELLKKPQAAGDVADIGKAHLHYSTDLERYRQMVAKALESLKGEISEPKVEAAEPKAEKEPFRKAGSARAGPVLEDEVAMETRPEEREEDISEIEDLEGPLNFDEDEGPGEAEGIEEEEVFFGGREKATPKKRK